MPDAAPTTTTTPAVSITPIDWKAWLWRVAAAVWPLIVAWAASLPAPEPTDHQPKPAPAPAPEPAPTATYRLNVVFPGLDWDRVFPLRPDPAPQPTPMPAPEPTPTPAPAPAPYTGHVRVYYVVPPDATPAQAALRTDASFRQALALLDMDYYTYESDTPEVADLLGYPRVAKYGVPVMVALDPDSHILFLMGVRDPATAPAQALSWARKLRGKP